MSLYEPTTPEERIAELEQTLEYFQQALEEHDQLLRVLLQVVYGCAGSVKNFNSDALHRQLLVMRDLGPRTALPPGSKAHVLVNDLISFHEMEHTHQQRKPNANKRRRYAQAAHLQLVRPSPLPPPSPPDSDTPHEPQ